VEHGRGHGEHAPFSRFSPRRKALNLVGQDLNGSQMKPTSSFIIGFRWLF
jgi:hypothetical protein